jgi:uncharacterized repeat protein (TIGR03803 family)
VFSRGLLYSILFGTTNSGGDTTGGTIFSIGTDGSSHKVLHEFTRGLDDGANPRAPLTLSGSTLFGTTRYGGDACPQTRSCGTVFSINSDGSGYQVLHEFAGTPDDGRFSSAGLTLIDSTLFGTTINGGGTNGGTVFSIVSTIDINEADYDNNFVVGLGDLNLVLFNWNVNTEAAQTTNPRPGQLGQRDLWRARGHGLQRVKIAKQDRNP